ncbi:hypothetical protein Bca52824_037408 [Brassica carinata]|uniref:Uncharacterized protein n=1 Tax=Brassica carinata TaxID=52824 RepID=A0A8X7V5Z2_BRACI|nr:hypothetical protein Bca52824_037408 [Brassica carinata]
MKFMRICWAISFVSQLEFLMPILQHLSIQDFINRLGTLLQRECDLTECVTNSIDPSYNRPRYHSLTLDVYSSEAMRKSRVGARTEEAIRTLNEMQLGGTTVRLSWGRSPSSKQAADPSQYYYGWYGQGQEHYGYSMPQDPNAYYGATSW